MFFSLLFGLHHFISFCIIFQHYVSCIYRFHRLSRVFMILSIFHPCAIISSFRIIVMICIHDVSSSFVIICHDCSSFLIIFHRFHHISSCSSYFIMFIIFHHVHHLSLLFIIFVLSMSFMSLSFASFLITISNTFMFLSFSSCFYYLPNVSSGFIMSYHFSIIFIICNSISSMFMIFSLFFFVFLMFHHFHHF